MVKREWNALRNGDRVTLHGSGGADMALSSGLIVALDVVKGTHAVGVLIDGNPRLVWPSRLAVHSSPPDPGEECWRCESVQAGV